MPVRTPLRAGEQRTYTSLRDVVRERRFAVAIHHLDVRIVSRGKGDSVIAAAAYRAGVRLVDERTGEVHDYLRRWGVDGVEILTPAEAEPWTRDRETLWNRAEMAECRRDAQLARSGVMALPRELDPTTNMRLGREFVGRHFVSRGMVADLAFHDLFGANPHMHWLSPLRELEGTRFAARKNRSWNDKQLLTEIRAGSAALINQYLRDAGVGRDGQVSHRSLRAQLTAALSRCDYEQARKLCRLPQRHLGKAATAIVARGEWSSRVEDLRRERAGNAWKVAGMVREVEIHPAQVSELREEVEGSDRGSNDAWEEVARRKERERRSRAEAVESRLGGTDLLRSRLRELDPNRRASDAARVAHLDAAVTYAETEVARIEAEQRAEKARRLAEEEERRRARRAMIESQEGGRAAYERRLEELAPGWRDGEPKAEWVDAALTYAENELQRMAAERQAEEERRRAEEERRRMERFGVIESQQDGRAIYEKRLEELDPGWRERSEPRAECVDAALTYAENELARMAAERAEEERRQAEIEMIESQEGGRAIYEKKLEELDPGWRDRGESKAGYVDAALTYAAKELARIEAARRAEEKRERREAARERAARTRKIRETVEGRRLFERKLAELAPGRRRTGKAPITKIDAALTYAETELSRRAELRRQAATKQREREAAKREESVNMLLGIPGGDVSLFVALDRQRPGWRESDARPVDVDSALESAEQSLDDRGSAIQHQLFVAAERTFPDASSTELREASEAFDGRTDADERARAVLGVGSDRTRIREIVTGGSHAPAPARQGVVGRLVEWFREQIEWLGRTLGLVGPMADAVTAGLPKVELFFGEPSVPAVGTGPWKPGELVGPLGRDTWTAVGERLDRRETTAGSVGYRPKDRKRAQERYLQPLIDGELRRQKGSWAESSGTPPTRESAREVVLAAHRSRIEELLLVESYRVSGEPAEAAGLEQHRDRVGRAAKAVMEKLPAEELYFGEPKIPAVGDEPWKPGEGTGRVPRDTWAAVREGLDRGETAAGNVDCQPKDRQRAQELHLKPLLDGELRRQERSWRSAPDGSPRPTRESARAVVLKRHWSRIEESVRIESFRVSGEPAEAAGLEQHRDEVGRAAKRVMAGLPIWDPWHGKPKIPAVTDESWEPTDATPLESAVHHEVSNRLDRGESATGRAMGYTHDDRERAERLYLDALTGEALELQRQARLASERTSPPQSREDIRAAVRREHRARLRGVLATACRGGRDGGDLGDGPGGASLQPADDARSSAPASSPTNAAGDPRPRGNASRARRGEPVEGKAPATRVKIASRASATGPPSPNTKQGPAEAEKKGRGDGGWPR